MTGFRSPDTPKAWENDWRDGRESPYQTGTVPDIAWRFGRELFRKTESAPRSRLGSLTLDRGLRAQRPAAQQLGFDAALGFVETNRQNPLASDEQRPQRHDLDERNAPSQIEPGTNPDRWGATQLQRADQSISPLNAIEQQTGQPAAPSIEYLAAESSDLVVPAAPVPKIVKRDDEEGSGHFGAKRISGPHKGFDILASDGEEIRTPFTGVVRGTERRVYPRDPESDYKGPPHRIVDIESEDGRYTVRLLYVDAAPDLRVGARVEAGQVVGRLLGPSRKHGPKMKDHLHIELWDCNGIPFDAERTPPNRGCVPIDPEPWLRRAQK
ncbi:MAG: M23 family metallopeptidase [Alphaproteobacteria bacterium]|nr:M23 family metallopeptidase [Alphaproteobacteria bacterium]